jgi:hypothetical protein
MKTAALSDRELRVALPAVVAHERRAMRTVIEHIAEYDKRQLYREDACSSMFSYCVERLNFSEDAAYRRIQVARLCVGLPLVLDYLEKIHLTGLSHLAPHLTLENHKEVLERACGKTKREIDIICAELAPKPDVPERVRALPVAKKTQVLVLEQVAKPARTVALTAERFAVQFTASKTTKDKLDRARELLPGTDLAEVFDRALTLLVADIEKKRFGKTSRPGKGKSSSESRRVPNAVKRQVFERDEGQCTFKDSEGHRCSNSAVEFDHALPHAFGGQTSFDNLRLRCRAHNLLAAEEFFGKAYMQSHQTDLPGP